MVGYVPSPDKFKILDHLKNIWAIKIAYLKCDHALD